MGVCPIQINDLTCGFNIGTNYSLSPEFNELTGFTEEEVREMLDYYGSVLPFNHTTDELIKVIEWQNLRPQRSPSNEEDTTQYLYPERQEGSKLLALSFG